MRPLVCGDLFAGFVRGEFAVNHSARYALAFQFRPEFPHLHHNQIIRAQVQGREVRDFGCAGAIQACFKIAGEQIFAVAIVGDLVGPEVGFEKRTSALQDHRLSLIRIGADVLPLYVAASLFH